MKEPRPSSGERSVASGLFAEVAVVAPDVRGARTFHYRVPRRLESIIAAGQLVFVGFGRRQLHGLVMKFDRSSPVPDPKPILDVVWEPPLLDGRGLEFLRWMAARYGSPLAACVESLLPPNLQRYLEHSYSLIAAPESAAAPLPAASARVIQALTDAPALSESELSQYVGRTALKKALPRLLENGHVRRQATLKLPSGGERMARLAVSIPEARDAILSMGRAPKRRAILTVLAGTLAALPISELLDGAGATGSSLKPLVDSGLVKIERNYRLPKPDAMSYREIRRPKVADESAASALEKLIDREGHATALVLGEHQDRVAAYVQAVDRVAATGRQVLILAPTEREAENLYRSFLGHVPGQIALAAHARTPAQRVGLWRSLRAGEIDVLVGPRSAVFAPLTRLGLVIVDREEDRNYKDRRATRVQARDAAVHLGRLHRCPVVLGTDTPAVETFYGVEKERFRFILMGSAGLLRATRMNVGRGWGAQRPAGVVDVVDMRSAPAMGHGGMISEQLHIALREAMDDGGRAVLFVNRRGSASLTICQECGYVFSCRNCSTNLVQHRSFKSLVCHVCNHRETVPESCPECGSSRLRLWGAGTEAVTETLRRLFPGERVDRVDSDVDANIVSSVADGFRRGAIRFLVGTTMLFNVAESLKCRLLGIVQADVGIGVPDYSAPERVFQSLMRLRRSVLGGGMDGRMIVQTIMPEHHVIEATRIGSYIRFFRPELETRRAHEFPPFRRLVRFIYSHKSSEKAQLEAEGLIERLRLSMSESGVTGVQFMGPAPALLYRERGLHRWHIMALGQSEELEKLISLPHRGWVVDADPVDLF